MSIQLKKDFTEFDRETRKYIVKYSYYTPDKKYFVNKENGKFNLFDEYDELIKEFKTLKEIRTLILKLNENKFRYLQDAYNLEIFIEICKSNILHFEIKENQVAEQYKTLLNLMNRFIDIAKNENLIISKSPYSSSFYAHKEDENISWGVKPLNSYRIADHWNFGDVETHCKTVDGLNYGLCICKMLNNGYSKI